METVNGKEKKVTLIKSRHKIDAATAETEFYRFADEMDLDVDKDRMDDDDKIAFEDAKNKIIDAIMRGRLTINDIGEPIYKLDGDMAEKMGADELRFKEPTGADYMSMDGKSKNRDMAKMFLLMGSMTGIHPRNFSNLSARHLKVCQAIVAFFIT